MFVRDGAVTPGPSRECDITFFVKRRPKSARQSRDSTVATRRPQRVTVPSSRLSRECRSPGLRSPPFKNARCTNSKKTVLAAVWAHVSVVYVANPRVVLVTLPRLRCRAYIRKHRAIFRMYTLHTLAVYSKYKSLERKGLPDRSLLLWNLRPAVSALITDSLVTPTPNTFSKVLPYKWEAYFQTYRRCTAVEMGGVQRGFPSFERLEAKQAEGYEWGPYCHANYRMTEKRG